METAILIAKVLGAYFIVSGVFVVTHQKTLGMILKDLFKNRAMTFVVGALLDAGSDWLGTFVKVIGWAILIKGALYILAPERLHAMVRPWSRSTLALMGVTVAAVGVYLVFFLG